MIKKEISFLLEKIFLDELFYQALPLPKHPIDQCKKVGKFTTTLDPECVKRVREEMRRKKN